MFRSFRHRIIAMNLALLMLFIVSVSLLLYFEESKLLLEVTRSNSMSVNKHYAEEIGQAIEHHVHQLNYISNEPSIHANLKEDMLVKMKYLMTSTNSSYIDIFYAPISMQYESALGQTGIINEHDYIAELEKKGKNYIISPPLYEHYEHMPAVLIVVPVEDNGQIVGVLGGLVDLKQLTGDFSQIKHAGESYGWIIDSDGLVIGHPNPVYPLKIMIQDADDAGYPGLSAIGRTMLQANSGFGQYHDSISNETKFVTYATVPHTAGWKLAITTLESDVFGPLTSLRNKILIYMAIAILFYLFIILILSKNIVHPIEELTQAVEASEKMNFSQIEGYDGHDELGHLVRSYNKMASSIQAYTKNLKHLVNERDETLTELSTQLDNHNFRMQSVNDELYDMKATDTLTGFLNHTEIVDEIENNLKHVDLKIEPFFSIMFIDLDNFTYLNDTFGRGIGDTIIFEFATHLKRFFRNTDIIGRYGWDEFIVIMMNTSEAEALNVLRNFYIETKRLNGYTDNIKTLTRDTSLHIDEDKKLGASMGISTYTLGCGKSATNLIREAHNKMDQMRQANQSI